MSSFIWYELMTTDADAARDFYGEVVGWTISGKVGGQTGGVDYRHIMRNDGGDAGGALQLTDEMCKSGARPCWLPYLHADDVDAKVQAITAEGGKLLMPAFDLPVGRIAMVSDPQGVPVYVMAPIPPASDPHAVSDVFSPTESQRVSWNELASPDLDASKTFYSRHFGFEFNEAMSMGPMGDYCFIDQRGQRLGAIMQRQEESRPASWMMYFRVPSVAAAKIAVEESGGSVMMGPHEVPSGDWIVVATDPQGAAFGLVGGKGH